MKNDFKRYRNRDTGEEVLAKEGQKITSLHMNGKHKFTETFILENGREFFKFDFNQKFEEIKNNDQTN